MFGCIYPDMCIAYNITSSDRSIEHYLQTGVLPLNMGTSRKESST